MGGSLGKRCLREIQRGNVLWSGELLDSVIISSSCKHTLKYMHLYMYSIEMVQETVNEYLTV